MKSLARQFGKKFVEILAKSPNLINCLQSIRQNNIKIRAIRGRCKAYYDRKTRTIYIGKNCGWRYQIIALAHEFCHALIRPTNDPIPGKTGRQEFIEQSLSEEVEAIYYELKILKELEETGINFRDFDYDWKRTYRSGGRYAIKRKLRKTQTSTTGEYYPEYYGGWYDDIIKPKDRLP